MTERERLIELLMQGELEADKQGVFNCSRSKWKAEIIADFLLANDIIVPLVKVKDIVYWIDDYHHLIKPLEIIGFEVDYTKKISEFTCYGGDYTPYRFRPNDIGNTIFITKKEAEKVLKERNGE